MNTSRGSVLIIGGGVIGTVSAYYLERSGWTVTVIEKGEIGQGTSFGNCGLVCPSHVLPLAEPGVIGKTFKALFAKNSPFSIKPRLDLALWSWLLQFAKRCNEHDMLEAANGIHALLESSMEEYRRLIEIESLDCEWQLRGLLFPYQSHETLNAFDATNHLLSESFGVPARKLSGAETVALEPALKTGLAGSWYYQDDAHLRPDKLLASLRSLLQARGVKFLANREMTSFRVRGNQALAVSTTQGEIEANEFVVAAGALTPFLSHHLGCRIPIQPGKGYSITMPRPKICPAIPLIFPETRVAATPFESGYRLGSTMEFAGYDSSINPARLQLLKDGARPFLQEPYCEPIQEEWFGWRPMTQDSLPIIDRSPSLDNVLIAAGHNMLGLSMATGTGKLVAEMLGGGKPHISVAPYRVVRFAG
jgi:D-amino-acid dehydrogenase